MLPATKSQSRFFTNFFSSSFSQRFRHQIAAPRDSFKVYSNESGEITMSNDLHAINPRVASVKPSKTMALTDLASSLKDQGVDII